MIQLVPVAPPASEPENVAAADNPEKIEPPKKPDNSCPSESDTIPLKLPRAMRSNGSKLLRERNADDESTNTTKEPPAVVPTSPVRPTRTSEEKENCRR